MDLKAQRWIRDFGPRKLCAAFPPELRVTDCAVYAWLSGKNKPTYERAAFMESLAATDLRHGGKLEQLTVKNFRAPHQEPPPPTQPNETQPNQESTAQ